MATSGNDVGFVPPLVKLPPSRRAVRPSRRVPGAPAPARDAWAASQALSWVAGTASEPADRLSRWREIPALVAELVRQTPKGARGGAQPALFG